MSVFIPDEEKTDYEYAVSACLCGVCCRYDGKTKCIPEIKKLYDDGRAVMICPEVLGGLPVPRTPCEISGERVVDRFGEDKTEFFVSGARKALEICKKYHIKKAILKQNSPSCGSKRVYDGSFSGKLTDSQGVAAKLFVENGISVLSEEDEF